MATAIERVARIGRPMSIAEETQTRLAGLLASLQPQQVGTPSGGQLGSVVSLQVFASTVNAAAVTVDTGYAPPAGHAADLDGKYNVTDRTAQTAHSGNAAATIRNYAGTVAVPSQTFGGSTGDAGLGTAVPSFSIATGTLHVTFTPPAGYAGNLAWVFDIDALQN